MYSLLRKILFRFPAESAHNFVMSFLSTTGRVLPLARWFTYGGRHRKGVPTELFDLQFPNPVGLAAGLDKNAECYNELSDFGFGFIEVGSLTPLPQKGNPRPRMFRLPQDRALINRMGINNCGVLSAISNFKQRRPRTILCASIAANSTTAAENIGKDYTKAFCMLYDFVDMFTVNISCPNVHIMSDLQDSDTFPDVMDGILESRVVMDVYKPVLVKISSDISTEQLDYILDYCLRNGVDGIVAANTTRSREGLATPQESLSIIGNGGLSGAPLYHRSLSLVRYIHEKTNGRLPIVASGGIMSVEQALEMIDAGASLLELYTGFIYEGPSLVGDIIKALEKRRAERHSEAMPEATPSKAPEPQENEPAEAETEAPDYTEITDIQPQDDPAGTPEEPSATPEK